MILERPMTMNSRMAHRWLLFVAICVALLLAPHTKVHADELEDLLLEKGTITKEEWLKLKADKEMKESLVQQGLIPTTGELITGTGYERFRFKDIYFSPGGFIEAAAVFRSANQNADMLSTLGNTPLEGSANSHLTEFHGSARQTRLSLLAESETPGAKGSVYVEGDFLAAAPTSNGVEVSGWVPRLRQAWANVELSNGWSFLGGQAWSLITTHRRGLSPRREFLPLTIDAQMNAGFNWTRQWQLRATKNFANGLWAAVSIENPETTIGGNVLPANVQGFNTSQNAQAPSSSTYTLSNSPGAYGVSTPLAPDLIAKLAWEPGWGHYEIKGLGRFFRDQLNGGNHFTFGGGVGAAALLPIASTLDFIAEGLVGSGIGRYASGVGTDIAVRPDGSIVTIPGFQFMTGLEWHPTQKWDTYLYYGIEYYERTPLGGGATAIGYGSPLADLSGCASEITGTCQAANKTISEIQPGFWYRILQSQMGIAAVGASYAYLKRDVWSGLNGVQPKGENNMVMVSFRYYFP